MNSQRPPAIFSADAVAQGFQRSMATPIGTLINRIGDGEGFADWRVPNEENSWWEGDR
jgi:hypothetical protein